MIIKTELELVRYIRHHIAGSEYQDVQTVKAFVNERTVALRNEIKRLENRLIELGDRLDRLTDPEERHDS